MRFDVKSSKLTEHAASTLGIFNPEFQKYMWTAFSVAMDMGLHQLQHTSKEIFISYCWCSGWHCCFGALLCQNQIQEIDIAYLSYSLN